MIIIAVDTLSQSHEVGFLAGFLGCGDEFITMALSGSGVAVRKRLSESLEVRALGTAHTAAAGIDITSIAS